MYEVGQGCKGWSASEGGLKAGCCFLLNLSTHFKCFTVGGVCTDYRDD